WTMIVAIELDVSIDVVDEMAQPVIVVPGAMERVEKPAEHLRDDVFERTPPKPLRSSPNWRASSYARRMLAHAAVRRSAPGQPRPVYRPTPANGISRIGVYWRRRPPWRGGRERDG